MQKRVYRIPEFCRNYSISRSTFYREVAAGRICIIKCGRTTLISRAAAQRWFKNLPHYALKKKQTCCRSLAKPKPRKKAGSFGGYFKLFIRKWK